MNQAAAIDIAILGGGNMGRSVLGHIAGNDYVRSITVYDTDAEKTAALRNSHSVNTAQTLEQILNDPAIKLIFITASNDAHKNLAVAALEAGKAVMCEKPMATSLADAQVMVDTAEHTNGFLQIGFELRYSHLYRTVKGWVERGCFGEIRNVQCTYISSAWGRHDVWRAGVHSSGGMFGEKLSHYVDLMRWWIQDDVEEVYAVAAPNVISYYEVHDNYHCTCRFKSGAVGQLTFMMAPAATFKGDPLQNAVSQQAGDGHALRYMLYGTKGAAETDVFPRTIKRWEFGENDYGHTSAWLEDLTWPPERDFAYFHNTHDQALDIIRRVAEGEPPSLHPRDALATTRLCFAAEQSVAERRPVRLSEMGS